MKKLRITLVRSSFGWQPKQRETVKGLGLKKIGDVVIREDSPSIRGMIEKIKHLVVVEEVNE